MGARLKWWGNVGVDVGGDENGERERTSGTKVLSLLILVTEGSSKGGRQMLANELSREAGEGGEMATTNSTQ